MTGGKQSCDLCTRKKCMVVCCMCVCMYVRTYLRMYVRTYLRMYVCMYRLYNEVEVSTVYTLPSAAGTRLCIP